MKKKKRKLTPEERAARAAEDAQRAETQRMVAERIAYHEAKAREEEERARASG
jgi:hypothetical protein